MDLLKSVGNVAEMDIAWLMKNASKLCAIIKNSSVLTVEKYCNTYNLNVGMTFSEINYFL